jgi:ParB family chromosome partitioning protein
VLPTYTLPAARDGDGGAVVSLDHMGGVIVHRGLLREEQARRCSNRHAMGTVRVTQPKAAAGSRKPSLPFRRSWSSA